MQPSIKEVVDATFEFEKDKSVWNEALRSMPFWHFMRHELFSLLLTANSLQGERQGNWRDRPFWNWLSISPVRAVAALQRAPIASLAPSDLLVFNHPRHVWHEPSGGWICPYSELLLRSAPYTKQVLETPFAGKHYHPNATQNVRYLEWRSRPRVLRDYLNSAVVLRVRKLADMAVEWSRTLAEIAGLKPPYDKLVTRKAKYIARRAFAYYEAHNRLLDEVRPKLVLQVVHYAPRNLVMTHLAHVRETKVAELQHGWIGKTHLAYAMRRRPLPSTLPDYILLFGDAFREYTDFPWAKDFSPAIGGAWLEWSKTSAVSLPKSADKSHGKPTILFVSQGSIGEQLSRFAAEFAARDVERRFSVIYKLHSGEKRNWKKVYPWLQQDQIRVEASDTPIYDLFGECDIQIGVYSTALFEGMAFGLSTYIAQIPGQEAMNDTVAAGLARQTASPTDFYDQLLANVRWTPDRPAVNKLWAPNPEQRFQDFLAAHCSS